ncbi:hypothetical protein NLX71_25985 [Paenibacillus sp. MZ04-78.2]|uniref:hypothetical protein n=1 Tax=Paenibacillus sp. MZ04-78.2 TaxID=2962034 RepID=UPI0020B6B3BF|nr:hypothetical protein [Paenibacillus sp. MZ04-78.2]MCP3776693.1 hypothetical protein [Paenibacillus sp. MZ04-78.2]
MSGTKKKIRGWKRRLREIDEWKRRVINVDMEQLNKYHRDYAKLWIPPFYGIHRRNPPVWFNRLILEAMLEVYENWLQKFKEMDEEFYLKIWLYDPHFINSQIVAAYKECLFFYDQTFDLARQEQEKKFPFDKYTSLKDQLEKFNWRLHIDSDVFTESDLIDNIQRGWMSENEVKAIKSKAYKVDSINLSDGDTDKVYSVKVGDVWVGSIKHV